MRRNKRGRQDQRGHRRRTAALQILCLAGLTTHIGCGEPSGSAQCVACDDNEFTMDDCMLRAEDAECDTFALQATSQSGCTNACVFTNCRRSLSCLDPVVPTVPLTGPQCQTSNGLFTDCSLCPDSCSMVAANGTTAFTCSCFAACPCGFVCGTVNATTGATNNVCVPAP